MNFHPQDATSAKLQNQGPAVLQIEDLNSLIDSLKRREENIIQLVDYNLKFKGSTNHMDVVHLRSLYIQLNEREKKRLEHEEQVTEKYAELYVTDDYQKKLMNKMRNKIIQLNTSAKDKLTQLGIFQHRKDVYTGINEFEESLANILSQVPIHAQEFLTTLLDHARKRFLEELDPDIQIQPENTRRRNMEVHQSLNADMNLRKMIVYKGSSPMGSAKAGGFDDTKGRESLRRRNMEQSGTPKRDLSKVGRSPVMMKSVDNRPSFDFREDNKPVYDMSGVINKVNNLILAKEASQGSGNGDGLNENDAELAQMTSGKDEGMRTMTPRQENMLTGMNLNNSTTNNDKSVISSRVSSVKKVKISSSNNKKSMCIEEPVNNNLNNNANNNTMEATQNQIRALKEAWIKNYDILKIEYQPLPVASKKETKKLLFEKIYKELLGTNTDIKRTIKFYHTSHQSFMQKKPVPNEDADEEEGIVMNSETSRPKSLTIQGSPNMTTSKTKSSKLTPNQRNLISIENLKEIMNCELGSDAFIHGNNGFGSNSMSITTKNGRSSGDGQKKNTSQKFLILPKLNINSDSTQSQNIFPSWPASSMQGSKALVKNAVVGMGIGMDFVTAAGKPNRYEKALQKGSERLLQNLIMDTKQDLVDQEVMNINIVNNRRGGNKGYLNFSNKNPYPMALQKLEPTSGMNSKPIGF